MSDTKQFVFGDSEHGQSVVTVTIAGQHHDPDEGFPRPVYQHKITTYGWEYTGNVLGAQGETPDLDKANQSLFAFLFQAVREENDMFPANVRCWAGRYVEEIADIALACEERVAMKLDDSGSLVESDEDSVEF